MKLILDDGREIILSEEAQEIVKKEISQSKKTKNFSRERDMEHWYIDSYGEVMEGGTVLPRDTNFLNDFTNKEFAEKIAFKQFMERKLLKFKEEYDNVDLRWDDDDAEKITFRLNRSKNKIEPISFCATKIQGAIYFSTKEIAEKCIKMYKDDLIKYFELGIW